MKKAHLARTGKKNIRKENVIMYHLDNVISTTINSTKAQLG